MKKIRIGLAILLTLTMVITMIPVFAFGATVNSNSFVDMPNDWSTYALQNAVSNGLISGFDEPQGRYIKPNDILTRGQMAAIVNRAFGAVNETSLSWVSDVPSGEWYAKEIAKAVKMGTFKLDSNMRPTDPITRQEAFTVLARAFKLNDKDGGYSLYKFTDGSSVAAYAREAVCAMVDAKYLAGNDGYLAPNANISRAQFAKVMDNLIEDYYDNSGQVFSGGNITGNVMVNVQGVTIRNTTIRGDLIIGDGVREGDITLDNVDVTGRTIIRGGGLNTVTVKGGSDLSSITVVKVDGNVRVLSEGSSSIDYVYIDDGNDDVVIEGTFGTVAINKNLPVIFSGAIIKYLEVNSTASMTMDKNTEITRVTVAKAATGTRITNNGLITKLVSDVKVYVTGTGTVTENLATDGATTLSAISAIVGTPKVGTQLTAGTIKPSGATVNYQWMSASKSTGTYEKISGATSSTYTPVGSDLNRYLKVSVTGKNSYTGNVLSAATGIVTESKINAINIAGVTVPVTGATPVSTVTATTEYTGTVKWNPADTTFASAKSYTATITLVPKTGYSVSGITANQFKVAGANTVTNPKDSGVITAIFTATAGTQATGLTVSVSPLVSPLDGKVQITSINAAATDCKIYYRVTSNPVAPYVGSSINTDGWTLLAGTTVAEVPAIDGSYIEAVEVKNSDSKVTRWGKSAATSDGFPVPVLARGLSISIAKLDSPSDGKVQITSIDAAATGCAIYYRVTSNPVAPYVGSSITTNNDGWTLLAGTTVAEVTAIDGSYIEAVEVKNSDSKVTRWGKSEAATNDGYEPPPLEAATVSSAETSSAKTIVLNMSSGLTGMTANPSAFTVLGTTSGPIVVSSVDVAGTRVTLTLNGEIVSGEIVTVSYIEPESDYLTNGTPVASFTDQTVNNKVQATTSGS